MRLRNEEERYAAALITPSMIVVFGVIIVPIVTTLVYSFVNINPLSSHKGEFAGLSFYIKTLSSKTFWDDFGRTLYFTVASTAIETVFGLLIALLLNQKFPGVGLLRSIIIIPWAIPTVVNGSLWKLMLNGEYGVINAILMRLHLIDAYQSWLGNPSTAIETVFGLMIALLLNQRFPGVRFLRSIIIIPWAIPTVVNGSLWKLMLNGEYGVINALLMRMHLIDAYQSWLGNPKTAMLCIVLADSWKMTPLAVIFFLAALQGIDKTRYEAAMVDGAGAFRRFTAITLPALKPTILVIIVMRTVEKFKAFDIFYLMTRGGPANSTKTLMYDTYLQAFTNLNYSEASTLAYLIVLVVVLMTLAYIRLMKQGDER